MTWEVLQLGLALLVWLTTVDKLRSQGWRPRDAVQRSNCLALFGGALFLTVALPAVYTRIGQLTGIANLALLLSHGLGVFTFWAFRPVATQIRQLMHARGQTHLLAHSADSPGRLYQALGSAWVMLGTMALMSALFACAPVHSMQASNYNAFMALYAGQPLVTAYMFVFLAYQGTLIAELFLIATYGIPLMPTALLRLRGTLQAIGWGTGLVLLLHEFLCTLMAHWGIGYSSARADLVRNGLLAGGVVLLMSGGILDLCRWGMQWLAHRRLYTLWHALRQAQPQIVLDSLFQPARSTLEDALRVNNLGLRLYRRTMEIHDGLVALQPYADPAVLERAATLCREAGVTGDDARAIVTAAGVRCALRAKTMGVPTTPSPPAALPSAADALGTLGGEVQHLRKVARAYRYSRIVDCALQHEDRGTTEHGYLAGQP